MGGWRITYLPLGASGSDVDLSRIARNCKMTIKRNGIGTFAFAVKYRQLLKICEQMSLSMADLLPEWFGQIQVYATGGNISQHYGYVFSGVLDAFPEINGSGLDADVTLEFVSWLGLCQGGIVAPLQVLHDNLDTLLVNAFNRCVDNSAVGRERWPLTVGHRDTLPVVDWTVDAYKTLSDYLVERCDNTTGAEPFDINFTPLGEFEIWQHYGVDVGADIILQFGGAASNVEQVDYPKWADYYTDVTMSGAGNGYGDQGNTLISTAYNQESRNRHYYFARIAQDSSVSQQVTLDAAATKYLRYTAEPIATPTVTINATRLGLLLCEHAQGGDLWVGDTVQVKPSGIYSQYPMPSDNRYRINQMELTLDSQNCVTAKLSMIDPTGGKVTNG